MYVHLCWVTGNTVMYYLQHSCVFNDDRHLTYTYTYVPTMEGEYIIGVQFAGREIPKSPYLVNIEGMAADPGKVIVEGAGVGDSGKITVNKTTSFHVHTTG